MKKWLTRIILAGAAAAVAAVPASVDLADRDIVLVGAACEGADCMPQPEWVCDDREDKCNQKFKVCRDLEPKLPGEDEQA